MCTLTYPFDEPNISRLSQAICQDDPNYNAIPPGISKNTIKIMKLMLSKDPNKRPSAIQIVKFLEEKHKKYVDTK